MTIRWPTLYMTLLGVMFLFTLGTKASDLPTDHTPGSEYSIDYSDLDLILKGSVLNMGPSTHKPPITRFARATGSRIQVGNTRMTNQEGNRVMIHAFEAPELAYLKKIRDEILAVPTNLPLEHLSKNEQLAYWFNLHNVIVLAKISEEYPVTYLNNFFDTNGRDSFLNQKQFSFNNTLISLADIQQHVLTNWNNPVVIYGFYLGAVGTPNVRTAAYKGATVYEHLHANAVDFVNSMRGTQIWKSSELRVSTYYERMNSKFPNFERDVRAHINKYAKDNFKRRIASTTSISADIEDWHIADLYNGRPFSSPGARYAGTTTDGSGNQFKMRLSAHAANILRARERKLFRLYRNRGSTVDIEELPQTEKPE